MSTTVLPEDQGKKNTGEDFKETVLKLAEGFWEGKALTKEDLVKLMPFVPWSTWDTPYFTFERMKAIVVFRYERMGDTSFIIPYTIMKAEEDTRRELKKLRKQENAKNYQARQDKKGPPQGGPVGGSSNSTGV